MRFTLAARVSLFSCTLLFSLQASASFARLTPYAGDPPLLAFAVSDADHSWLARANSECQSAFDHAGSETLAAEDSFLRRLKNLEIAAIEAEGPNADSEDDTVANTETIVSEDSQAAGDETTTDLFAEEGDGYSAAATAESGSDETATLDDKPFPLIVLKDEDTDSEGDFSASDEGTPDLGLWKTVNDCLWGNCDREEPGVVQQFQNWTNRLTGALDVADMNLLALADLPSGESLPSEEVLPADEFANEDANSPFSEPEGYREQNSYEEQFVPADAEATAEPTVPTDQCHRDGGISSSNNLGDSLQAALLPSVSDEATARAIISSATLGGLLDRGLYSTAWRDSYVNSWPVDATDRSVAPSTEIALAPTFEYSDNFQSDYDGLNDANAYEGATAGETNDEETNDAGELNWERYVAPEASEPALQPAAEDFSSEENNDSYDSESAEEDDLPRYRLEWELVD